MASLRQDLLAKACREFGREINRELNTTCCSHCLVLDGVYRSNAHGEAEFVETSAPSDEKVLQSTTRRVMKQLVRRGILVEDQGETYLADDTDDSEEARTLRPLHWESSVYRISLIRLVRA